MTEHLTNEEFKRYLARQMQPAELLKTDKHLAHCDLCSGKIADLQPTRRLADFNLFQSLFEESEHLSYQQLESYVDEKSGAVEREIADAHLEVCAGCMAQFRDLVEMREMIAADLRKPILSAQTTKESALSKIQNAFSARYFLKFGFATFAVLFVASILGILWLMKPGSSNELAVTTSPNIDSPRNNQDLITNSSVNVQQNINPDSNTKTESNNKSEANTLNDSQNLPQNDTHDFPPPYQKEIERVLANGRLNVPREIKELNNQSGTLMGGGTETIPFALLNPVGKVILSNRPNLRWNSLAGAESYVVNIFDADFNKVASSPQISRTSWQMDKPLERGKTYLWQVTAIKNGEEIKSPIRPAPDARFKILEAKRAEEISRLSRQYKNEYLFLGIMYANAGLLDEAEREFQKEINKNPNSKQARKLLQEIRNQRK